MKVVTNERNGFSLYNHAGAGKKTEFVTHPATVYVPTTIRKGIAQEMLQSKPGYIYTIHATPNFIDLTQSLGGIRYNPEAAEREFSALGGIRWDQVVGWNEMPQGQSTPASKAKFVRNKDYNPKYDLYIASPAQPQLAGFPKNHEAWTKEPWRAFSEANGGKSLQEHGLKFMATNGEAVGWTGRPPLFVSPRKVGGSIFYEPLPVKAETLPPCKRDGLNCVNKRPSQPKPGKGGENAAGDGAAVAKQRIAASVEQASAKEFAELSLRYQLKSFVETRFRQPLRSFRADKLQYRPVTSSRRRLLGKSPSLAETALKSAGKSFKVLGAGLYVHGVVEAFADHVKTVDRVAALTAIVPVVGCVASLATDLSRDKVDALNVVDDALCLVGDALLFTPLAPVGVAIHLVRLIMGLARGIVDYFSGPDPEMLRQVKAARDEPWNIFLRDHLYETLSSKEFGARLGSALAVESLACISEGAETIGILQASQQEATQLTNETVEKGQLRDYFQAAVEHVRRRVSVEIVERQRQVLIDLVNNVRDQHEEASLRALADQYNESFIEDRLAGADEEIIKYIRNERPPLPNRFAIAYLVGQSIGQDAELPTLSPPDVEQALSSSAEPAQALEPVGGSDNIDWKIHPLTLSLTDYLQKKQEGISKEDADAISAQQIRAVMQLLDGKHKSFSFWLR
ncbi:putative enterotoxin [Cordyceps sp. RAO-2017]|nr:putative enterotoxin [Cordyceps sp. RAO-2017]